jgi:glycosyltransferase involved in cell wall biosynthesis
MRIGLVIYGNLESLTGGYLYDRIVVEGLMQRGHDVEVLSLQSGPYPMRLLKGWISSPNSRLGRKSFDVLLQDELCHPSLIGLNRRLRRRPGPPVVAVVHHMLCAEPRKSWQNRLLEAVEKRYLATVDGFIFNSQSTRQTVELLLARPNAPHVVAYPSGDRFGFPLSPEEIASRCYLHGPLQLLFLGNVIPRKGLLTLLKALGRIDPQIWRLAVVGGLDFDPAHASKVRQLSSQLGLSDRIRFLGQVQDRELVQLLSTSQVFCMPYAYEGFGIAILEAMAFGMPAVCCLDGAAGETISHGKNGFLLSSFDIAGLEPLLKKLYEDREELKKMSIAAQKTSISRSSWSETTAAIDYFLHLVAARKDRKSTGGPPYTDTATG